MNISLIDYIGEVNGGIAILLSWILDDEYFEFIFWFNTNNDYKIFVESNLTNKLGGKMSLKTGFNKRRNLYKIRLYNNN